MIKRLAGMALAISFVFGMCFNSYADSYEKISGNTYETYNGNTISGVYERGIDVSKWQNSIDWRSVASDDVQFVIMRTRRDGKLDERFREYASGATSNGLKMGVYLYMNATTVDQSVADANWLIDLICEYPVQYPVVLDVEDQDLYWKMDNLELNSIINAFCNTIKEAGYTPMLYLNDYWIKTKLDMSELGKWPIWVARYAEQPTYKNYTIWQATNKGQVSGIKGYVDIDFAVKDMAALVPADKWMFIHGNHYYYKNYKVVKNDWINDGQAWYFMDGNGLITRGWMKFDGFSYYLDTEGKMVTGVQTIDGVLYAFYDNGALMTSGQIEYDNKIYDIAADGTMSEYIPPETEAAVEGAESVTVDAPAIQ